MKLFKKSLFLATFTTFSLFSIQAFDTKHASANTPVNCNTISSYNALATATDNNGGCYGTPSVYAIKVFKIGFCTADPTAGRSGNTPDYSQCTITYSDSSGTEASFAAGTNVSLPSNRTTPPEPGSYSYAFIEISNTFTIAASIQLAGDGDTYYSTTTPDGNNTNPRGTAASKTSGAEAQFNFPVKTFGANCDAATNFTLNGTTLTASLLNGSDQLIGDSNNNAGCTGVSKLLGVANLATPITISPNTTACFVTFTVSNSGSLIQTASSGERGFPILNNNVYIMPGPFKASFTVVE